jgi:hypothetical protein
VSTRLGNARGRRSQGHRLRIRRTATVHVDMTTGMWTSGRPVPQECKATVCSYGASYECGMNKLVGRERV